MKILMLAPRPPDPYAPGGQGLALHAQLMGLLPRHEVTLITRAGWDEGHPTAIERLRAMSLDVRVARSEPPTGFEAWRRRAWLARTWARTGLPWLSAITWEPRLQTLIDETLAKQEFDIISIEDKAELGVYRLGTRAARLLTDVEVRHPVPRQLSNLWPNPLSELDHRRWPAYQRTVWRRFDRIQVLTRHDAEGVGQLAPEVMGRVRINPFGIDLPPESDLSAEEPNELVFVGSFGHYPNVDAVLWVCGEIMPILRARRPGVHLSIVGHMPPRAVQELAGPDITVTGRVPRVEPYLERAAVVLAPARLGGGQRSKVLLGMGLGKAVVTTPLGAEGMDLFAEPPLLIAADAVDFADAISWALDHPAARRDLGMRAREFVRIHYSPDAYGRRLEGIYDELLAEAAR